MYSQTYIAVIVMVLSQLLPKDALADLFVAAAMRSRGIGRHLVNTVCAAAKSREPTFVWRMAQPQSRRLALRSERDLMSNVVFSSRT
jgi:GNAT superfamily N-acetyltransferase